MTGFLVACAALIVYAAVSLRVGDRFVFSRYSMYAKLTSREEGAVLYVRVGERFVAPDDLDAVHGLDVAALDPTRVPCSQQWVVYEAQRWFTSRTTPEPQPEPIEVGYRILRVAGSAVSMELRPLTSGTGRLRT